MTALVLPWPVSANRYWRSFVTRGHQRAIVCLSDEARQYKRDVAILARAAGIRRAIAGRVGLGIHLYPARPLDWAKRAQRNPQAWDDDVRSIDLDNCIKVLLDAIKDIVIEDDKWVRRIVAERMKPDAHGARVVIEVEAIAAPASPQADLYAHPDVRALVTA